MESEKTDYKDIYWREMFYLLDDIHYAEYYITRAETIDKGISIIIAIGTSATIASWGIFKNFSIVWGLIVGVAQLLVAIKPFLSFNTNSKFFREYIINASQLFCDFENDYFDVMEDILTPELVNKRICTMRTKQNKIKTAYLKQAQVIEWKSIQKLANKKTNLYMKKYSSVKGSDQVA